MLLGLDSHRPDEQAVAGGGGSGSGNGAVAGARSSEGAGGGHRTYVSDRPVGGI